MNKNLNIMKYIYTMFTEDENILIGDSPKTKSIELNDLSNKSTPISSPINTPIASTSQLPKTTPFSFNIFNTAASLAAINRSGQLEKLTQTAASHSEQSSILLNSTQ